MEKAKTAIIYGADAIYLAGKQFGMRAGAGNFSLEEISEILEFAHQHNAKVYVTVNVFPHQNEIHELPKYLQLLNEVKPDGLIIADLGIFRMAKKHAPDIPLHISTQANSVNSEAINFWHDLGASRVVLAREVSYKELLAIRDEVNAELEVFVHGAMCMAYSGRCLISHVLTGRDANRGACTQCCRWKYSIVEEKRPGEYMPVFEDERGTYLFNSKDLCLIEYIPELINAGVDSLKIEGRMKSAYYVATVVRAYRKALDDYLKNPDDYQFDKSLLDEVAKVSHRPYYTGFFFEKQAGTFIESSQNVQTHDFVGVVREYDKSTNLAYVEVRNRIAVGDEVEIMQPHAENKTMKVTQMINVKDDAELQEAHANYDVKIPMGEVKPWSMLRIKIESE